MGDKSKIEWTEATWNPVVGCSVVSPGCTNCYAMRMARRLDRPGSHYEGTTRVVNGKPVWTGAVKQAPEHTLTAPLRWRKPRRIFVNSMSDLFHDDVPDEWIDRIFAVMALCPQHSFQVLTKRPERMQEYMTSIDNNDGGRMDGLRDALVEGMAQKIYHDRTGEDPSMWLAVGLPLPNVWLGTSVEDQARANERIPYLSKTPAAVRFLSVEPLLGPVDVSDSLHMNYVNCELLRHYYTGKFQDPGPSVPPAPREGMKLIDWVIVGGESGPGARPMHPDWARSIRDQCQVAGVPFFMKQMAKKAPIPNDLMIREYPRSAP